MIVQVMRAVLAAIFFFIKINRESVIKTEID